MKCLDVNAPIVIAAIPRTENHATRAALTGCQPLQTFAGAPAPRGGRRFALIRLLNSQNSPRPTAAAIYAMTIPNLGGLRKTHPTKIWLTA
jgi:hypothetical protein